MFLNFIHCPDTSHNPRDTRYRGGVSLSGKGIAASEHTKQPVPARRRHCGLSGSKLPFAAGQGPAPLGNALSAGSRTGWWRAAWFASVSVSKRHLSPPLGGIGQVSGPDSLIPEPGGPGARWDRDPSRVSLQCCGRAGVAERRRRAAAPRARKRTSAAGAFPSRDKRGAGSRRPVQTGQTGQTGQIGRARGIEGGSSTERAARRLLRDPGRTDGAPPDPGLDAAPGPCRDHRSALSAPGPMPASNRRRRPSGGACRGRRHSRWRTAAVSIKSASASLSESVGASAGSPNAISVRAKAARFPSESNAPAPSESAAVPCGHAAGGGERAGRRRARSLGRAAPPPATPPPSPPPHPRRGPAVLASAGSRSRAVSDPVSAPASG